MSGGLTPCRQLRPSSRQGSQYENNVHGRNMKMNALESAVR